MGLGLATSGLPISAAGNGFSPHMLSRNVFEAEPKRFLSYASKVFTDSQAHAHYIYCPLCGLSNFICYKH